MRFDLGQSNQFVDELLWLPTHTTGLEKERKIERAIAYIASDALMVVYTTLSEQACIVGLGNSLPSGEDLNVVVLVEIVNVVIARECLPRSGSIRDF